MVDSKRPPRPSKADDPAASPDTPSGSPQDGPTLFGSDDAGPATPDVQPTGDQARGTNAGGPVDPPGRDGVVTESPEPEPDPFDPESLRLGQDFAAAVGVRKLLTTVPVRKPSREWFVRTHPDPSYQLETAVLELKEDREMYLVAPALWPDLSSEPTFGPRLLITAINRQGNPFLWPIRLSGPDGKLDDWSRSALEAATAAQDGWVRITANMGIQAYDVAVAPAHLATPVWPDLSFRAILDIAFREKKIVSLDHPVLRRLRGEV